jgi:hypothetical protein
LWIGFVVQLPIAVAAIYTSGARSIHCLFKINAASKMEFDAIIGPLKRPAKILGGDPGALSGVRLTRLPGCKRPEKDGFQRLLYLHPDPPRASLVDLPVLFRRDESLARWKALCPRWNKQTEAHL